MLALILFIAFGLIFGYFATLNTNLVAVNFGTTTVPNIPLYLLVLVSLGIGIVFSSLFYAFKSLGTRLFLWGKQGELSGAKKEIAELTKKIHQLEIENAKLKARNGEGTEDENSL